MKFVCITEPYRHFRGWVFAFNKPTDVKDSGTIRLLLKHPEFRKVDDEQKEIEAPAEKVLIPDVCPKCGKRVKRGKFMHAKYCGK